MHPFVWVDIVVRPLYRGCNLNLWHCFCLSLVSIDRTKKQICNCGVVCLFFSPLFISPHFSFARICNWFLFAFLCRSVHFISFFLFLLRLFESSDVHSSSVQRLLFILVSPLRCKTFTVALDACTHFFLYFWLLFIYSCQANICAICSLVVFRRQLLMYTIQDSEASGRLRARLPCSNKKHVALAFQTRQTNCVYGFFLLIILFDEDKPR